MPIAEDLRSPAAPAAKIAGSPTKGMCTRDGFINAQNKLTAGSFKDLFMW